MAIGLLMSSPSGVLGTHRVAGGEEELLLVECPFLWLLGCSVISVLQSSDSNAQGLLALKTTLTNNLSTHGVRRSGRGTNLKPVAIHFPQDRKSIVGGGLGPGHSNSL